MGFIQIRTVECPYVRKINYGEYDCILQIWIDLCQKMSKSGCTCGQLIALQKKYKLNFQPVSICQLVFSCSSPVFVLAFTSCPVIIFIQIANLLISIFSSDFNKKICALKKLNISFFNVLIILLFLSTSTTDSCFCFGQKSNWPVNSSNIFMV